MARPTPTMYNADAVADQINAFKTWDRDANLPDVIDRVDLRSRPDLVANVIAGRAAELRGPEPPLSLTYPKDDGTHRITCLLDPFDDVRYAILVSQVAGCVEKTLPPDTVVQSTRFRQTGRVYGAEGWRDARRRRGSTVDHKTTKGVGGFDVGNHFGTVQGELLGRVLHSCLVSDGICATLLDFLADCGAWPGSPLGLPAGPMASALLGTVALLPVDRRIARLHVPYERCMDDFVVAAPDIAGYLTVREAANEALGRSGQALNPAKDWYDEPVKAREFSLNGVEPGGPAGERSDVSATALQEAITTSDAKLCRYILGGLRGRSDGSAVPLVASDDVVWELVPRYAGEYLLTCRGELTNDHLEVITERCARLPTERAAAGIAHGARVLAKRRVPGVLGSRLHESADRISTGRYRAAAPFLYHGSSVSKGKPRVRCERAIDTAGALRDVLSARGLIAGVRYDTRSRTVDAGLNALASSRSELAPTVAWVKTGTA